MARTKAGLPKQKQLKNTPPHVPGKKDCPVFTTLSLIANKWAISILRELLVAEDHALRFNALKKALNGITQRELTKRLREFEESGIVLRIIYPESPPHVEYALTELGRSLNSQIQALSLWAEKNSAKIEKSRAAYQKSNLERGN